MPSEERGGGTLRYQHLKVRAVGEELDAPFLLLVEFTTFQPTYSTYRASVRFPNALTNKQPAIFMRE